MAGQTIVNFDGLSADAADKMAQGMVQAAKAKIDAVSEILPRLKDISLEDSTKLEKIFAGNLVADGNCGNGCA